MAVLSRQFPLISHLVDLIIPTSSFSPLVADWYVHQFGIKNPARWTTVANSEYGIGYKLKAYVNPSPIQWFFFNMNE
jgi:hypothetical protein